MTDVPMTDACVFFPGTRVDDVAVVGGKAASLIRMTEAGLNVPPGAALTTSFFAPWLRALEQTEEWAALAASEPADWASVCPRLKARGAALPLDASQRSTLAALRGHLDGVDGLFAVRSSSPEEDLGSASFAGLYETELGVPLDRLEDAVRRCFASSLDVRVLSYKREHGLDPLSPKIAVVVQRQIRSDVAGVAFSIDPITNDYDHAVFDAAWGLGESVVSGAASPDHFVVDKPSLRVVSRTLGDKQLSVHVQPDGGTAVRRGEGAGDWTLDDARLAELTIKVASVERLYGVPVDVEWAYAEGEIFVLQARPITAWVPIPEELRTEPGAPRRLYMDIALSGGLTINAPITPLGQSWMRSFAARLLEVYVGELPVTLGEGDRLWSVTGGRMYQDLSNVLWLMSPERLARSQESKDALMAATLANVDAERYRAPKRPAWVSLRVALRYPVVLFRARRLLAGVLRAMLWPRRARARFDERVRAFEAELSAVPADRTIATLQWELSERVIRHVLEVTMPPLSVGILAAFALRRIVPERHAAHAAALERGLPGNVVVEMVVAMHRLAGRLSPADAADPEALARRLERGDVSAELADGWRAFLASYGWRGPQEVDLGVPRYADEPLLALRQICMMAGDGGFDPEIALRDAASAREAAFSQLMEQLGGVRRALVRWLYSRLALFAGTRDTPKHDYLLYFAAVRRRAMHEGRRLAEAGRLDAPEHVFDLTLEDLADADADGALDLRARRESNVGFLRLLRAHVRSFPAVIDSRGRILRPSPRTERPGELTGVPISAGIARGPVKALREPGEKTVEPGDVLVAHTTDPGWTPLFINAVALVFEVGGVLQHGAVVARELGKPCVVGVPDLLSRLRDGQMVEVDGGAGVVRVLP